MQHSEDLEGTLTVQESVIRRMTRLAIQHNAVNLAQGFTDEAPPYDLVWGGIAAMLGGTDEGIEQLESLSLKEILGERDDDSESQSTLCLRDLLGRVQNSRDRLNQYSFPFGLPELREAIARYTLRFSGFRPDPEREITVVLGATEGLAAVLRATCSPGDGVLILQPFHEMYPSQAKVFGIRPEFISLKEDRDSGDWILDREELEASLGRNIRALILNTPHNPTGKVFTRGELEFIAASCRRHGVLIITDEIYEHILYGSNQHHCLAALDGMRDHTIVVNSISKTGNATGWRIGWVLSPEIYTPAIRGIHDTLVVQAPTPLQKASIRLLDMEDEFYQRIKQVYEAKKETLLMALRDIGFRVTSPQGSYYLFADYRQVPGLQFLTPMDAAMFLLKEKGVAAVPGDNFYRCGPAGNNYLRFAFCRSLNTLQEAAQRLSRLESSLGR